MNTVIVFAGNYNQFSDYVRERRAAGITEKEVEYIYPDRLARIVGLIAPELITIGTWYENGVMRNAHDYCTKRYGK